MIIVVVEYSDFYVNKWDYWLRDSSFGGVIRVYGIGIFSITDLLKQLTESRAAVRDVVGRELCLMRGIKFYEYLLIRFVKEEEDVEGHFNTTAVVVTHEDDVWGAVELSVLKIIRSVERRTKITHIQLLFSKINKTNEFVGMFIEYQL